MPSPSPIIVVTGANGFVGTEVCRVLAERGAQVRALVRRSGTAPRLDGVTETVGDFTDPQVAAEVTAGAAAAVTTVHPMSSDRATQERIGVTGTTTFARAAAEAGVERFVHISTAAVYDRSPTIADGDVDESSALVPDDSNDYSVTKRDADHSLASVDGPTRVLVRPPAILGPGPSSVWNTLRPAEMREDSSEREAVADHTYAWVHVTDLASLVADVALGRIAESDDPATGPVTGACTAVNVAGPGDRATQRDYVGTVARAIGVEPEWKDAPAWTGRLLAERAHGWGWTPTVDLARALDELVAGL